MMDLLISLYRHWTWADRIKELFEFYLREEWPIDEQNIDSSFLVSSIGTCMCMWYSLVYATCEGLEKEAKVDVDMIAADYSEIKDLLRRFRNATFHVQRKFLPNKLMNVITNEDIVVKIRSTHKNVGAYLERESRQWLKEQGDSYNGNTT